MIFLVFPLFPAPTLFRSPGEWQGLDSSSQERVQGRPTQLMVRNSQMPLGDEWQRELNPRQLLRNAPELTAKVFVLCGLGALDKHRSTAHVHQVLRPDKAVARNVSNCCVEYRQRTHFRTL